MELLTLGQVVDSMKLDEVALLVNCEIYGAVKVLAFDSEGLLKSYNGGRVNFKYTGDPKPHYVIMKRELYELASNK